PDWKEDLTIGAMDEVYRQIATDATGICYTVYYYDEFIMQPRPWVQGETEVKRIAINGVYPEYNTIKNKTYPFVAPVYAIIRSDLDKNSMAYKMYEWLQTNEGKSVIEQSGYIADLGTNITQIVNKNDIQIFPNPTSGIVYSSTAGTIKLYNLQGVLLQETFGSHIDLSAYTQGLYLLQVNDTWTKVLKK
ncbi:MAG: T9SS type A sorting domain-containing protein, partial [Bacteroidetes bacterium]|nr:T9SS type A sorting domain-containing protein [Bacteroidota bacterium]